MLLAKGLYGDGRTFESAVAQETAAMVAQYFKQTGLPMEMIRPMKPWMIMLMLTAFEAKKAGLDASLGLDKYFYDKAKAAKKPVIGLETAEFQIDRFDKMPDTVQEQMLRSTLTELDAQRNELKSMVVAWQRGDTATLEKNLRTSFAGYPAAYTSLIAERNRNWIPTIETMLEDNQENVVIVGAGHLAGEDSVLDLLVEAGYTVNRIQ